MKQLYRNTTGHSTVTGGMRLQRTVSLAAAAAMLLTLGSGCAQKEGYVYYLNFKPEADAAWQELAQQYTAETGVPVKIVTAASNSYQDTLSTQLGKATPPTLFICGNAQGLYNIREYA